MSTEKVSQIVSAWYEIEGAEPDISTERLIAMTSDRCGVDADAVLVAVCTNGNGWLQCDWNDE